MRYHWGLGVGHTYSHGQATAGRSENSETGIAENEADDDGASEPADPLNDAIQDSEAEDQDGDLEGSDSDSERNLRPSTIAAPEVNDELDSDDEEIYGTYEDSDV